jgi:hypothetical protein
LPFCLWSRNNARVSLLKHGHVHPFFLLNDDPAHDRLRPGCLPQHSPPGLPPRPHEVLQRS